MGKDEIFNVIEHSGIVAGMRGNFPPEIALQVCNTLFNEDINVFEFTLNSVQAVEAMQAVRSELGEDIAVGMGTVLSIEDAKTCIDAGANYIMSPAFQPEVVQYVEDAGVMMIPGVATPSEAVAAWAMGVKLLKLFPIGALGLDYFKAMFGPLSHMKFCCNGAMTAENAHALVQAGAVAVGMGGWLTGDGSWPDSKLRSRARILVNGIEAAKSGKEPLQQA